MLHHHLATGLSHQGPWPGWLPGPHHAAGTVALEKHVWGPVTALSKSCPGASPMGGKAMPIHSLRASGTLWPHLLPVPTSLCVPHP